MSFPPLLDFLTVALFLSGQLLFPTVLVRVITPHRHSTPEHFPDMVVYTPCISQLYLSQSNCYTKKKNSLHEILSTSLSEIRNIIPTSSHRPSSRFSAREPSILNWIKTLRCQHKKPGPSSRNSHSSSLSAPPSRG
jgi:hypothetical protein